MTTLGKYLGGGLSFGAFGGRAEVMATFDPSQGGALTQAGTFNNNVVSMAAAVATLRHGLDDDLLAALNQRGDQLRERLGVALSGAKPEMWVTGRGSMLTVHVDDDRWLELYFHQMLAAGHYVARRGFIALSLAISDEQIDDLVASTEQWAQATNELD
jgi:glutamate-1-semialdehyde 2,1-aminomutase